MARRRIVPERLAHAKRCQHSVVKPLGSFDIVRADHDMIKHPVSPFGVEVLQT
jgi:hypothetical protein